MTTALAELDAEILEKLAGKSYHALDLIQDLDSRYSESEIQRSLATLLSDHRIILTSDRQLKIQDEE